MCCPLPPCGMLRGVLAAIHRHAAPESVTVSLNLSAQRLLVRAALPPVAVRVHLLVPLRARARGLPVRVTDEIGAEDRLAAPHALAKSPEMKAPKRAPNEPKLTRSGRPTAQRCYPTACRCSPWASSASE